MFAPKLNTSVVSLIENIVHSDDVRIDFVNYPNASVHPRHVLFASPIQDRLCHYAIALYCAKKARGVHEGSRLDLGTGLF
jgi:hypothetical protein